MDTWFCFTFIFRTVRVRIVPNNAVVVIRTALERTDSVRRGYARPCFGLALACDEGRSGAQHRPNCSSTRATCTGYSHSFIRLCVNLTVIGMHAEAMVSVACAFERLVGGLRSLCLVGK